jgi:hypothetical protein
VFECSSAADLVASTKSFIQEVAALALPELQIVFKKKEMPPQEDIAEEEESKD